MYAKMLVVGLPGANIYCRRVDNCYFYLKSVDSPTVNNNKNQITFVYMYFAFCCD